MATRKKAKRAKPAAKRAAHAGPVTTLVNGQVVGTVTGSGTIVEAAQHLASAHGLKTFSIRINGAKIAQPDASKLLTGAKTLEVYAKDARA